MRRMTAESAGRAKIEAGKFSIDPHEMNLVETIDFCLNLTQWHEEEGDIELLKGSTERSRDAHL